MGVEGFEPPSLSSLIYSQVSHQLLNTPIEEDVGFEPTSQLSPTCCFSRAVPRPTGHLPFVETTGIEPMSLDLQSNVDTISTKFPFVPRVGIEPTKVTPSKDAGCAISLLTHLGMCSWRESNPHALRHCRLKTACLPLHHRSIKKKPH